MTDLFTITLLRHGESQGNFEGRIQGQSDPPLTETGRQQARALANYWQSTGVCFDRIIASPLSRAYQTARTIGNVLGVEEEIDPAWMERGFGTLEGMVFKEVLALQPPVDLVHTYEPVGGSGESILDLYVRAGLAVQKLVRRPAGRYLVVSHGAFLNMVLYNILGLAPQSSQYSPRFRFANTGYTELTYRADQRQWSLLSFNRQEHLANGHLMNGR